MAKPAHDTPVTAFISRRVQADRLEEFKEILNEFTPALEKQPGFISIRNIEPGPETNDRFISLVTFSNVSGQIAWEDSPVRKELVARLNAVVEGDTSIEWIGGLDVLASAHPTPKKWKTVVALIIWINVLGWTLGPALSLVWPDSAPEALRAFALICVNVGLISYVFLPWTTRLLNKWAARAE